MLVLTRKKDQAIMLGDNIEITILEIKGDQIRLGIAAPKDLTILRKELYIEVTQENQAALNINVDLEILSEMLIKQKK
jgi:carbon storage regulator